MLMINESSITVQGSTLIKILAGESGNLGNDLRVPE